MFEKELLSLLLQDFPESIAVATAAFALLRLRFDYKKILIISILQAFTNLIRLLPIAFGMHSIILLITLNLYIQFITKEKLIKILTATILLFIILMAMQAAYLEPLLEITKLSYQEVASSPVLRAAFTLPYELVFIGMAILLNYRNNKLNRFKNNPN